MNSEIAPPATAAPQMPDMPPPAPEHAWLQRFVGEWVTVAEITCEPGKPPMKCTGTETSRMLGGFWLVAQGAGDSPEMPFANVLTLGFDPKKGKYIGTWVDSMMSHMWRYEGGVNDAGTTLTLETEGECPGTPGKVSKFREVTEFFGDDHRVFTSSIQGEDGAWSTVVTVDFRRKK